MVQSTIDATDASLDEPLPDALGANLQTLFGRPEQPRTVADWVDAVSTAVRDQFDREIHVDDLCHVDDSEHVTAVLDDDGTVTDRYHFACFFDGLVLAGMTDDAVRVETRCPETGAKIAFSGTLDDLRGDAAVVSIGVTTDPTPHDATAGTHGVDTDATGTDATDTDATDTDATDTDATDTDATGTDAPDEQAADDQTVDDDGGTDTGSFAHVYGATCPYVKAFASTAAYETWSETVDAETVAISPAVALAAARRMTG